MKMRFYAQDMDLKVYKTNIQFRDGEYETEDPKEQEILSKITHIKKLRTAEELKGQKGLKEKTVYLEVAEIEDERMIPVKKSAKDLVIKKEVKIERLNKNELMEKLDEEGIEYKEEETKKEMIEKLEK